METPRYYTLQQQGYAAHHAAEDNLRIAQNNTRVYRDHKAAIEAAKKAEKAAKEPITQRFLAALSAEEQEVYHYFNALKKGGVLQEHKLIEEARNKWPAAQEAETKFKEYRPIQERLAQAWCDNPEVVAASEQLSKVRGVNISELERQARQELAATETGKALLLTHLDTKISELMAFIEGGWCHDFSMGDVKKKTDELAGFLKQNPEELFSQRLKELGVDDDVAAILKQGFSQPEATEWAETLRPMLQRETLQHIKGQVSSVTVEAEQVEQKAESWLKRLGKEKWVGKKGLAVVGGTVALGAAAYGLSHLLRDKPPQEGQQTR